MAIELEDVFLAVVPPAEGISGGGGCGHMF